jgi:hypothetical protein
MNVKNIDAEIRFNYNKATSEDIELDQYTENTENSGGIKKMIGKAATNTGLISKEPELTHLVSYLRQEWDP